MRTNYGLGQLSAAEKSDILDQHKSIYNGYQTMQPQVSNTQPLYVFDPAGDKNGLVVNNKGEVKKYTNMGINEQVEEKSMCEQCGGTMKEDICEQCGESVYENEEIDENWGTVARIAAPIAVNYISSKMEEEIGHLDDIYDEEDLNPNSGFDYIEGSSNDVDTFEGMHKNLYKEDDIIDDDGFEDIELSTDELGEGNSDDGPFEKGKFGMKSSRTRATFEPTPKEKDIIDKLFGQYGDDIPPIVIRYLRKLPKKVFTKRLKDLGLLDVDLLEKNKIMDEQGGNVDDMDTDSVEPAYDFESEGPGGVYPVNEYDDKKVEYEKMESAWVDEEIDEVDVSGSQGIYGDMDPAYDFDSEGPGKAGPYQRFSYNEDEDDFGFESPSCSSCMGNGCEECDGSGMKRNSIFKNDELVFNLGDGIFDDEDDIDDEWEEIDTDLQEEFKHQKNKISEMFNRMSKFK